MAKAKVNKITISQDGEYWSVVREREGVAEKCCGCRTLEEAFHYARVQEEPTLDRIATLKYYAGSKMPKVETFGDYKKRAQ